MAFTHLPVRLEEGGERLAQPGLQQLRQAVYRPRLAQRQHALGRHHHQAARAVRVLRR